MAGTGLYVHLPYCTSICPYCDFNAYTPPKGGVSPYPALQAALLRELAARAPLFVGPLDAVYFGGGTPSLAPPSLIAAVLQAAQTHLGLRPGAEVTLEANPGTLTLGGLQAFREAGINRLSMGWQSTHDKLLRVLGRAHSAADSHAAWALARQAGFLALSLDLIFAVPGQTAAQLQADLDAIVALRPEHVSLYAMTIKPGTPFARRQARGTLTPTAEDTEAAMMQQIDAALAAAGYAHYEVSNYAQPGHRAVHNSLYWQGGQYLGIGPGAHSFCHTDWQAGWRWEAIRSPQDYIAAWQRRAADAAARPAVGERGEDPTVSFCEALTPQQMLVERMLCGLRHVDGVPLDRGPMQAYPQQIAHAAAEAVARGWGRLDAQTIRPTSLGLQHVDAMAALFLG
jgi:oxygen-independent coproporphyrinogen-3 oxidase